MRESRDAYWPRQYYRKRSTWEPKRLLHRKMLRNSQDTQPGCKGWIEILKCLDGGHITCLLTALFLRHLPQLVEAGKIYTAVPPLYRVKTKTETHYFYSDEELKKSKLKGEITRFKGLNSLAHNLLFR